MFRRRICTEPGSEQVGSVPVLGAEVVQVGPIKMFGPKQNYSSKHFDRTSAGPGSEQLRRLNSLLVLIWNRHSQNQNTLFTIVQALHFCTVAIFICKNFGML